MAAAIALTTLVSCGGDDGEGPATLTWYINPDPNPPEGFEGPFGQAGIAERCSTDAYRIETELLPPAPANSASSWPAAWPPTTRRST